MSENPNDKPITVIELFAGYGSQRMALERLKHDFPEFDYQVVAISEINKDALSAYRAVHGDCPNLGDITKIDWSKYPELKGVTLVTYSFPCTNISSAGKQEGFDKGSETSSSLLWECEKCFRELRPKYLLMENVKALTHSKFMPLFNEWIGILKDMGYTSSWQIINSKSMGIPQNRDRVFMVSILSTEDDSNPHYEFPQSIPLTKCVEDYLLPIEEIGESFFIDKARVTDKVLSDILDQPNVRDEVERVYHEECTGGTTQVAINLQGGVAIPVICNMAKQSVANILPPYTTRHKTAVVAILNK